MPAHWPDRNHTRYFLAHVRVISDRVSLAAPHHSITSELSPVLLLRSPAAANWKQIVMKALFTPHLLHFSQLCPHFLPWFNSKGITCSEMFGKAFHSLPGVSLSHSSLWQLSDTHYRAHSYKAFIQLPRAVAGKRLEAAQIPAATTYCIITLHGNESKRQPVPKWGWEAVEQGSKSRVLKNFIHKGWHGSVPQPSHEPQSLPGLGSILQLLWLWGLFLQWCPCWTAPWWFCTQSHRLVTPDEMDPCGQQRLKYHTCGKFRLRQEQNCK